MALTLCAHPLSSYCQKVLIALYEHGVPFSGSCCRARHPKTAPSSPRLWPLRYMPVLTDGQRVLRESSIIIEYLDLIAAGGTRLIPEDAEAALRYGFTTMSSTTS